MRVWIWSTLCDITARAYLFCCKRLWVAGTGTPVPERATVGMYATVVKQPANDNGDELDEMVQAAAAKYN
jgi:hypothetical protein